MQSPWINKTKRKQDLITVVTLLSGGNTWPWKIS